MLMKPGIVPGRRSGRKRRIVAVTVRVSLAISQINKISHARHMALLPTPASVFNDQTRYGYLGKSLFTLSFQKSAVILSKITVNQCY